MTTVGLKIWKFILIFGSLVAEKDHQGIIHEVLGGR
jgi:hypothetical protein